MADPNAARASVLIVDDERGPRESLRMILSPSCEVIPAESGPQALELLRTHPIDLTTIDINMPGMKGDELMRTVRREFPDVEVIVITGYGTLETATDGIRYGICDYLQKPFDVVQVSAAVSRALSRRRRRKNLVAFLEKLGDVVGRDRDARAIVSEVEQSLALRGRLGELLSRAAEEVATSGGSGLRMLPFFETLAETIESQDPYMRGHARRVAFYASLLAERLGLSADEQADLRIAAFLHDIGNIGVSTALLVRPDALAPGERKLVARHVAIGVRLLEPLGVGESIAAAVRHHHEWWDGTGYPDGLHGEAIPIAARVIQIADAFDAMTCDRPYRGALSRERALAELERFAGQQFDPRLAKEFVLLVSAGALDGDLDVVADAVAGAGAAVPAEEQSL